MRLTLPTPARSHEKYEYTTYNTCTNYTSSDPRRHVSLLMAVIVALVASIVIARLRTAAFRSPMPCGTEGGNENVFSNEGSIIVAIVCVG